MRPAPSSAPQMLWGAGGHAPHCRLMLADGTVTNWGPSTRNRDGLGQGQGTHRSLTFPREGIIDGALNSQRAQSQGWREGTLTSGSITVEKLSMVM